MAPYSIFTEHKRTNIATTKHKEKNSDAAYLKQCTDHYTGGSGDAAGSATAGVEYMVLPYMSPTPFQAETRTWYGTPLVSPVMVVLMVLPVILDPLSTFEPFALELIGGSNPSTPGAAMWSLKPSDGVAAVSEEVKPAALPVNAGTLPRRVLNMTVQTYPLSNALSSMLRTRRRTTTVPVFPSASSALFIATADTS